MHRRGFLGTLLGASALAIVDPETLAWRQGERIYSIPQRVHVPRLVQFGVDMDLTTDPQADMSRRWMEPALRALADRIDRDLVRLGKTTLQFVPMELPPEGLGLKSSFIDSPDGRFRDVRMVSFSRYDPVKDSFMRLRSLDVLVKI
jgi:hypothetical protein